MLGDSESTDFLIHSGLFVNTKRHKPKRIKRGDAPPCTVRTGHLLPFFSCAESLRRCHEDEAQSQVGLGTNPASLAFTAV